MVITNPSLKPKERFLEIVRPYFEKEGYVFYKARNTCETPFNLGFKSLRFDFRISTFTEVTIAWSVNFIELSKVVSLLEGQPKSYKKYVSAGTSLSNFTRWHTSPILGFPLYDIETYKYDDFSINSAAQSIIQAYEHYVIPYFQKLGSYTDLLEHRKESFFIIDLVLAKYCDEEAYRVKLNHSWNVFFKNRVGEDKESYGLLLNRVEEYLKTAKLNF